MTDRLLDQDVHLDVDIVAIAIAKKVVIDIIEIEKGKERGKENAIVEIVNVEKEKE